MRYQYPEKIAGDLRESGALFGVLAGLAIVLLTDATRGLPIYLAITNLFVLLVYLYHLSAVTHPQMPGVDDMFPPLAFAGGEKWVAGQFCSTRRLRGVLVVFLRGAFCAASRRQLHQLHALMPELARRNMGMLLLSGQSPACWPASLAAEVAALASEDCRLEQLDTAATNAQGFIADSAAPFLRHAFRQPERRTHAVRPSAWLLDADGYILWRDLAMNYRVPVQVETLRSQLSRVED
ncbi:hypothetical protein JF535_16540 [Microbulbifer salipaludis]|uniref:Thioredoxin domain-containing protein n=1 Tax=Microbulbifer salipaludis TaxID=187980 RepID=A0ABS3EAX6_9GAMM|nr:hypothetical protein [Microbulbifer salipaludis]MBN8432452.1 hypothetical protein [Microbulbifer salipaludis]